jgi:hypothetical protein
MTGAALPPQRLRIGGDMQAVQDFDCLLTTAFFLLFEKY